MTLAEQITKLGKRLDDTLDGVLGEQISTNSRLDDLDFQIGEIRDLVGTALALLKPDEGGQGGDAGGR